MTLEIASFIATFCGMICLIIFGHVRLKSTKYENALIVIFWVSGALFHAATLTAFVKPFLIILGPLVMLGFLFGLRALSKRYRQPFALDRQTCFFLGGVGLWLGMEGGFLALALGSVAGLFYGAYKTIREEYPDISIASFLAYQIPTAQSFAIGIFISALWTFKSAFGFV